MFKRWILPLMLLLLLSSHDMYLKLDTYFLAPDSNASINLFNGTFDKSDNTIARDRMVDVSLVGQGSRLGVDTSQWSEDGEVTVLNFKTGQAGTWVAGVSTAPRNIEMAASDFNQYLRHDGALDMLEWREKNGALDQDAVEQYAKHVKTIFQVGKKLSQDWQTKLGYPIEFVPMSNPYDLHPGHDMKVQLLWQGEPLSNQLVYIDSKANHGAHTHTKSEEHAHDHQGTEASDHQHDLTQYRTDAEGKIKFNIAHQGIWYLRTIHMATSQQEGLTHESNWATLTFEVKNGHSHSHKGKSAHTHTHSHEGESAHTHDHTTGPPAYAYWIGSLLLVVVLFIWFNRKKG